MKFSQKLLSKYGMKPIAGIAVLLLLIVVFLLPIELTYSVSTIGRIVPERTYVLRMSENGTVQSLLYDNLRGGITQSAMNEIDRGDAFTVQLNEDVLRRGVVAFGDTVCRITSALQLVTLAERVGALSVAERSFDVAATGDKESLIREAKDRLAYAGKELDAYAKKHKRIEALFAKDLVSDEEVEASRDEMHLLEISVEIAKAELQSLETGLKPEELQLRKANIAALEQEIHALQSQSAMFVHVSPVSGILPGGYGSDTLLQVFDTTGTVIELILSVEEAGYVDEGTFVFIENTATGETTSATIERIDCMSRLWRNKRVLLAYAKVEQYHTNLQWNSIADCSVACGTVPLRTYVWRTVASWLGGGA